MSDTGCATVQVRYGGAWGYVCGNGWSATEARVVCSMLGLNGGTAGSQPSAPYSVFWMYNVRCTGEEVGLQSCAGGRAGAAELGSAVCPSGLSARVCCVSAEQAYFAEAYGDGGDESTVETLTAVQDDAQSFAADIRDALQFAKDKLDQAEAVKDMVDRTLGEKSNSHGVKSSTVVAKAKQQFGGSLSAKSVKPMAMAAVRSSVRLINIVAPEVGIILDVAIGFFDALNTFIETGSLVSAALTFANSMISSVPVIGSIWGMLTGTAEDDDSESDSGSSLVLNQPLLLMAAAAADATAFSAL